MVVAVLVGAGSGQRLGAGMPKAIIDLGGRPMIAWSVRAIANVDAIEGLVIAAPPGYEARIEAAALEAAPLLPVSVVTGGDSRSESVKNALAAAPDATVIAIHDAARPLVRPGLFDRCIKELARASCEGVVAAAPIADTIKRTDEQGRVTGTLDRSHLWSVQTPQVFRADALRAALSGAELAVATDDAQLVERSGGTVTVVEAPAENLKVTVEADLRRAELLIADAD